jgi:hypothetical protein
MDWRVKRAVTSNVSPFTSQTQTYEWVGADGLSVTVTLPPMTAETSRKWRAWLWQVTGGATAFLLGDPSRRRPYGTDDAATAAGAAMHSTVNTSTLVNGTNNAMAASLNLRGFRALEPHVLSAGDLISANYRMYEVLAPATADASGNATVSIRPSLREALTDGMAVQTHDAQGLFRLSKPEVQVSNQDRLVTISFDCVEAR